MSYSKSKWLKHIILSKSSELAKTLPATRKLSYKSFLKLLHTYGKVIIKPSFGSCGAGVIQVSKEGNGFYELRYGNKRRRIQGDTRTYKIIKGMTKKKSHIVQQKIPLARINLRPFDIRVMVQKKKKSKWEITGKLVKIAGPGFIVTNVARSKGRVVTVSEAVRSSNIKNASISAINKKIDKVALKAVTILHSHYRWINTVGFDIALDAKSKVWIIEPNFTPNLYLFLRLKDKSVFRRIMYIYNRRK